MQRMQKIADVSAKLLKKLPSCALLVSGDSKKPNIMTVGWGSIGMMWGKPIITVPVRHSRYSHGLMDEYTEFTMCFPKQDDLIDEVKLCGSKSARDTDKVKETGLTLVPSNTVEIGNISECNIIVECKKLAKVEMPVETLIEDSLEDRWYPNGNPHTIYYAEILDAYER